MTMADVLSNVNRRDGNRGDGRRDRWRRARCDDAWMLRHGMAVQTPLGKGVVREVRNGGRVLVDVRGRATEFRARDVQAVAAPSPAPVRSEATGATGALEGLPARHARSVRDEVDLHGRTVDDAMALVDEALNEALLAGLTSLRVIHGRSGGRLRAALHRRLREIPSVRGFHVDPRNEGVTVIAL
jgi:dsDNA-specific endonuclease/ATPase MutS2